MLTDFEREHPAIVASPGGILWIDRARHLPQRRDRVCGAACKGEGTPGTSDGGRRPASVNAGEWIRAQGNWVQDKEHGLQFKATFLKCSPPTSREGIGPTWSKS